MNRAGLAVTVANVLRYTLVAGVLGLSTLVGSHTVHAVGESPALAYKLHCMGCHLDDGTGSKLGGIPSIPGLAGHFLKHEKGRLYLVNVPGVVNAGLPDKETAAILNYILKTWASNDMPPDSPPFTEAEVHALRQVKVDDITLLRREISADLLKRGVDLHY